LGPEAVRLLLTTGRKDDSGDFTKGAELDAEQAQFVLAVIFSSIAAEENASRLGGPEGAPALREHADYPLNDYIEKVSASFREGIDELSRMKSLFYAGGYRLDKIRIDPSV